LQYLYLPAATVLKRWAGQTANSVFVHVDASLQGMDVIRAFAAVDYFIQVTIGFFTPDIPHCKAQGTYNVKCCGNWAVK
jgi:hypothetical protein